VRLEQKEHRKTNERIGEQLRRYEQDHAKLRKELGEAAINNILEPKD